MWWLWIIIQLVAFTGETDGQQWDQTTLDDFSQNLVLRHNVLDNTREFGTFRAEIVLENKATRTLSKDGNWSLHFDSIYMIEPKTMHADALPNPDGAVIEGQGVKVHHVAGTHFWLEPTDDFYDLPPGKERRIQYTGANWMVAKTDTMPNWYLAVPSLTAKAIASTADGSLEFVSDYRSAKQWKRYTTDQYNPYTAQDRFDRNYVADNPDVDNMRIVPSPYSMEVHKDSNVTVDARWKVYALPEAKDAGDFLRETTGMGPGGADVDSNVIKLMTGTVPLPGPEVSSTGPEAYSLSVDPTNSIILITGEGPSGVFYGVQTLLGLMAQNGGVVYRTKVSDAPRFEYRGMHLDVARNFHPKEDVLRLLDVMAMYKMNKLHMHLTDDEAWRLEIPGLPELTNIGSKRCTDPTEKMCLTTQLGSGPSETTSGSGHYTVADYKEILTYANRRHVQVIPEVDSPGHARAAIKAMEARRTVLKEAGNLQQAEEYLLMEEGDPSRYMSVQMFVDNAINPCLDSAFVFIDHVVQQIKLMHQDVQPLRTFHFGGDEVARGAWENSTKCRLLQNAPNVKTSAVKELFFKRVANITNNYGLNLAAWEDGLMKDSRTPYSLAGVTNNNVYAHAWDNVWEWGAGGRAYTLANNGYKVVMSQATHLYFDHPYEPDPVERGFYWAPRYTDTQKTFGFMPKNLYGNIDVRRSGVPLKKEEVCLADGSGCPPLTVPGNLVGMQGHLWSETVRTSEELDYMIYPRIIALAERAWHEAPWESKSDKESRDSAMRSDWEGFAKALGKREFRRLDRLGVKYRVPPPGAKMVGDVMKTTSGYPGLSVQYSTDNGKTWNLATDEVTVAMDTPVLLRTRSADLKRFSRIVIFNPVAPAPVSDQSVVDYIAKNLQVSYAVLDNLVDGSSKFLAQITLKNIGTTPVQYGNWAIWFCSVYHVVDSFPGGKVLDESKVKFVHENGCLHRLEPVAGFQTLRPDERRIIKFKVTNWSVSRSDTMPNWYVSSDGMKSVTIASTAGQSLSFVGKFDTVNKWKRYDADKYDPYTPDGRFARHADAKDLGKAPLPVIPTPLEWSITKEDGVDLRDMGWKIVSANGYQKEAEFLKKSITSLGYTSPEITTRKPASKYIELKEIDPNVEMDGEKSTSPEAYSVIVSAEPSSIVIMSLSKPGTFYGVQTVIGLALRNSGKVPEIRVKDCPRFGFRGMHMDIARNFQSKEAVMKHLDVMAMYKLNKFHFHLSDDEGWRLEIPGLPELTQVGGKRCDDVTESTCVLSALGSGPNSDNSGSGFFTVKDYQEILEYAAERHIEVIPEIDSPGHAHAAIKSMEARKKTLDDKGDYSSADANMLIDPDDHSVYESVQMYRDNAINPCIKSTYDFIDHVMTEILKMHGTINPLRIFHFGGDEVAKGAWLNSTFCQTVMTSVSSLKEYFTGKVARLAADKGLNLGGWEDGLLATGGTPFNRTELPNSEVYGYAWDNVWEWGAADRAYKLANAGYKVVLSQATHLYFDQPYEPDPEERGFYWATRYTDTEKVHGFKPDDIYSNVDTTRSGDPMTRTELCGQNDEKCTILKKPGNIVGMQGQLWSETVRTKEQLDYMIYPRLVALAERAWRKAPWESISDVNEQRAKRLDDWTDFANTLGYQELSALDRKRMMYRLPPPGARLKGNKLLVNSRFPGLQIEASFNNGQSWLIVGKAGIAVDNEQTVMLVTKSPDNKRRSRAVTVHVSGIQSAIDSATTHSGSVLLFLCIMFRHVFL